MLAPQPTRCSNPPQPRVLPGAVHRGSLTTPTTCCERLFAQAERTIWAKLELLQPSGSVKDRSALSLVEGLERAGKLTPGATLVASTSGNLGVALARQAALRELSFIAVVDELANAAALKLMRVLGARIDVVKVANDDDRLAARIARVAELLSEIPGAVEVDQYGSQDNPDAHQFSTLPELVSQLGGPPDHLYVATSTAGTLTGCQRAIESHGWSTRLVAVDAVGSILFGGTPGRRILPGLGAGVESIHAAAARPTEIRRVDEAEMIYGARLLARREGIVAGASTGALVSAIESDLDRVAATDIVAFMVHDSGLPYLDTVYDDEWVRQEICDPDRALRMG